MSKKLPLVGFHRSALIDFFIQPWLTSTANNDTPQSSPKDQGKGLPQLVGKYLRAGVVANRSLQKRPEGVLRGGPLSPLLANMLLDELLRDIGILQSDPGDR